MEQTTQNIIIVDPVSFEQKRKTLIEDGPDHLQVMADFDRTLTTATSNSCYGIVENSSQLSERYRTIVKKLYEKYFHIEISPDIPKEEKVRCMVEWWSQANDALVSEKANIRMIPQMVATAKVEFRKGGTELFDLLHKNNIPMLVFSAGIKNILEEVFLQKEGHLHPNIHVISNQLAVDSQGVITGFQGPIIHVLNKNKHAASETNYAWFKTIASKRKNVLLMGDSTGDSNMAEGLHHSHCILKIGFLNSKVEENLREYKQLFDVLILNDGDMGFGLKLVEDIVKNGRNGKDN